MRLSTHLRRGTLAVAALALASLLSAPASAPAQAASNNPCDVVPGLPFCDTALGPLVDVTANAAFYQPALVQPVPIKDYCPDPPSCSMGDPEDGPPPPGGPTIFAAGYCETEVVHQAAPPGEQIPPSTKVNSLPAGIPGAPPGKNLATYRAGPYCMLKYIAGDFDPLCAGCRRILLNYPAIPFGTYAAPNRESDGHWAARFTLDFSFSATTPFNAHSPNFKNLCSDKQFNPAAGSDCVPVLSQFDMYSHAFEGDTTVFHHFPYEGRYFNGPSYLAGTPGNYHWVQGAYFDVDPVGASALSVFYNAGYRGKGDLLPDTDWSYGCACEAPFQPLNLPGVPGAGHTTWSSSLVLTDLPKPKNPGTISPNPGSGPINTDVVLPPTSAAASGGVARLIVLAVLLALTGLAVAALMRTLARRGR